MERVVADLVVRPHVEDRAPGGGKRRSVQLLVIHLGIAVRTARGAQMRREFLPDGPGDLRVDAIDSGKRGCQGSVARRVDFSLDRIDRRAG